MVKNHLFEIVDVVGRTIVAPTSYTLAESGLVCELCTAGDQLNIAKVRLMIAGENEEIKEITQLKQTLTAALLEIPGIEEVSIKCRLFSDLSHCPAEIQHIFQ